MAMSGRNTRAVHSDDRKIRERLARHKKIMDELIAQGMDRETASREAFKRVVAK